MKQWWWWRWWLRPSPNYMTTNQMTSHWSYGAPPIESVRRWGRGWSLSPCVSSSSHGFSRNLRHHSVRSCSSFVRTWGRGRYRRGCGLQMCDASSAATWAWSTSARELVAAAAARAAFIVVELPSSCPLSSEDDVPLILWSTSYRECSTVGEGMI